MTSPTSAARSTAMVCAASATIACLVAQWLSCWPDFSPDLLLDISTRRPLHTHVLALDPGFRLSTSGETYDGVYYWAMAQDPFATGFAHTAIDLPGYRYGHPLFGWLGAMTSLGSAGRLPEAFWLLSIASMAAAGWTVSRLAHRLGASAWWGLAVAASPGLLFSSSSALTEPLQLALACSVLLVWLGQSRRPLLLAALTIALCLTKEQLVIVPAALALHGLWQHLRRRTGPGWPSIASLAAGPAALAGWLVYLRSVLTSEQLAYQPGNIGLPFSQLGEVFTFASYLRQPDDYGAQIGSTAPSLLVGIAVIMVAGTIVGLVRQDALGLVVGANTVLLTCLGWRTLLLPHESLRIPAVALVLALLSIAAGAPTKRHRLEP